MPWYLEEEISKFIDIGIALGVDFNDKKVRLADIVAKAYSKLRGVKLKMKNIQFEGGGPAVVVLLVVMEEYHIALAIKIQDWWWDVRWSWTASGQARPPSSYKTYDENKLHPKKSQNELKKKAVVRG
ncbi:hypothetical protein LWI29_024760 [Acer saccharum]|uniref:Uncharacterized protein n=1 Tax=Acer saccharum TaxID=4024 RepID=A0AA39T643_ACESA|nr:hypothetical protein LWI29_024760 [Acer saccharum]